MGVSTFPGDATTPEELVSLADKRLYHAKKNGRNRVVLQ
jgi:diguanylate cyclase (GGDEF)-like protein